MSAIAIIPPEITPSQPEIRPVVQKPHLPRKGSSAKPSGLAFWMEQVLKECERASVDFAADPVHDLRVALRRCRSMADGLMAIDPDSNWKKMKKAGKAAFSSLGELRDVQVMEEWVQQLGEPGDPVSTRLLQYLASREGELKQQAAKALAAFDRKQWKRWAMALPRRAARVHQTGVIFRHLALERWMEAYDLHRKAMRNRSRLAYHSLRIGIKRFRYIVENFLPEQHARWSGDLKLLQDLLGEVHDLDVLWTTALQVNAFPNTDSRVRWHKKIIEERERRITQYRDKMLGEGSLWREWRAQLPHGEEIEAAALARLKLWAAFLDPDVRHSMQVARLALQLYDGLAVHHRQQRAELRTLLKVAAWMHEVGRSRKAKNHHKAGYRLIANLKAPLGYNQAELHQAAAIARYHRGALPHAGQKSLTGFTAAQRRTLLRLAGILRLAEAFDFDHKGRIHRLTVHDYPHWIEITAAGYSLRDRHAENIAGARHLLETVYRKPIIVKPERTHSLSLRRVVQRASRS